MNQCEGPLIWYEVELEDEEGAQYVGVILECACGYILTSGCFFDEAHQQTPILREGLAA